MSYTVNVEIKLRKKSEFCECIFIMKIKYIRDSGSWIYDEGDILDISCSCG